MITNQKQLLGLVQEQKWDELIHYFLGLRDTAYTSLHTHCLDLFDADNQPERLAARMAELNANGLAVTQHGVASAIEPMKKACAERGLKFVPGVETYYTTAEGKRAHLILLAKNDEGYGAISEAISESQDTNGFSVMSDETLIHHFGPGSRGHKNVFATSACIQGPLALILRHNTLIRREADKIRHRNRKTVSPDDGRIQADREKLESLRQEWEATLNVRNAAKKKSETKFAGREKTIERLLKKHDPSVDEKIQQLEAEKKAAKEAVDVYKNAKATAERLKKQISAIMRELKDLESEAQGYTIVNERINALMAQCVDDDTLVRRAETEALRLEGIFGKGHFFIELQNHGFEEEGQIYPVLAKIAKETGIPCVASNDAHMISGSEDEILHRQILRSMRFKEWNGAEDGDKEMYLKSDADLTEWLLKILDKETVAKAMVNTRLLFDSCQVDFKHENHYPVFPISNGQTAEEVFDEEIERGIKWRFPNGFPDERYAKRINYESGVIKSMGYVHYHLVVKDFLEYGRVLAPVPEEELPNAPLTIEEAKAWVKKNGWRAGVSIGPGRGSAVGSLVCYVLGITSLDPIANGLLFERFLNPERVSMPDIDSDLSNRVRPYVIRYVTHKYGQDAVCGIMTMTIQAPKGSIRIAAKYYDLYMGGDGRRFLSLADTLAKKVPIEPGIKFRSKMDCKEALTLSQDAKIKTVVGAEPDTLLYNLAAQCFSMPECDNALMILKWARIVEGSFTSYSAHAAGIVISDGDAIKKSLPLRWNDILKEYTTQMDMVCVEENGFLKMDFLGLKTLDVITDAVRAIADRTGRIIDVLSIPLDDAAVYAEIFRKGRTNGVFQFASTGMKSMLKQFGPTCFEDLVILVSMFRPGPMQYLDDVIKVKNGEKEMSFLTPELEPILGKTYAAIVYQEQVMEIFQKLAGYSLGGADQVRRFMSKKKHDKLAHEREAFINGDPARGITGCVANGISREAAVDLFDQMTDFASYAFNKSHAAAYALNAYQTAWLKYHYPAEFLMGALNWATREEYAGLIGEAKTFHVAVKAPDINKSGKKFTVDDDGAIRFGLSTIKDVGQAANELLEDRAANGPFSSLRDVFERTDIKKDAMAAMVKAGCFDRFSKNRQAIAYVVEAAKTAEKSFMTATKKLEEIEGALEAEQDVLDSAYEQGDQKKIAKAQTSVARFAAQFKQQKARVEEADSALNTAVRIPANMYEDRQARMANEHDVLGTFVSANPLDDYPDPKDLRAVAIENLPEKGEVRILGVATDLQVKHRKADGKPMLFLTMEDHTGVIDVKVFTKVYAEVGHTIEEGRVYLMRGRVETEKDTKDGDAKMEFTLYAMKEPARKQTPYILTVPSFALWHITKAADFKKSYEDQDGAVLYINDISTGKMRKLSYLVSNRVEALDNIKKIN